MQRSDGMRYAPTGKPDPVVEKGEFLFGAIGLDHGHIYGMCNGLLEAGGDLTWVYDPDPEKVNAFCTTYPQVAVATTKEQILEDQSLQMIASAAVPADRATLGLEVMAHGKDFFVDKPPLTTLEDLQAVRRQIAETGQKYMAYYSERLHVEAAVYAGQLIEAGAVGRVVQVINLAPHRMNPASRPAWFFDNRRYGGILVDLGSHQIEQILHYTGAGGARIVHSQVANYTHKQYEHFEDFGDVTLVADNGATGYFRVDWFTPEGLPVWGDGRTLILGTDGYIELRKYIDIGHSADSDHLYLVNHEGDQHITVRGKVGFPFFGRLILDSLNRTERAMTQEHALVVAELCIQAQMQATRIE